MTIKLNDFVGKDCHVTIRDGQIIDLVFIDTDTVNQASDTPPPSPTPLPGQNKFVFSRASLANLEPVKPELMATVKAALKLTTQDFMVYEGQRSIEQQKQNVAKGVSQTMQSKHLIQSDGFAHAVDLVPWIDGKLKWDWEGCYRIAWAMDMAATALGYANHIRWGGAWDRVLSDFGTDLGSYEQETKLYASRHAGSDFLDGPHFEWVG